MGILALAATIVLVNAPTRQSAAKEEAGDFASALIAALDSAVVAGGVYRLEITPASWRIASLEDREWTEFRRGGNGDMRIALDVEEATESNLLALTGERAERRDRDAPTIVSIDPFGDAPPFFLRFADGRENWIVRHDETGAVRTERE